MYRPLSLNRFKLFMATILIVAAAGCGRGIYRPDEELLLDCRDEFEVPDSRPLCEHVVTIQ